MSAHVCCLLERVRTPRQREGRGRSFFKRSPARRATFEEFDVPCRSSKVDIVHHFLYIEQALPSLWRGMCVVHSIVSAQVCCPPYRVRTCVLSNPSFPHICFVHRISSAHVRCSPHLVFFSSLLISSLAMSDPKFHEPQDEPASEQWESSKMKDSPHIPPDLRVGSNPQESFLVWHRRIRQSGDRKSKIVDLV